MSSKNPKIKHIKPDVPTNIHNSFTSFSKLNVNNEYPIKIPRPPILGVGLEWNFWGPCILSEVKFSCKKRVLITISDIINDNIIAVIKSFKTYLLFLN